MSMVAGHRVYGFSACGLAALALWALIGPANASEDGIPNAAAVSELLRLSSTAKTIDFDPLSATGTSQSVKIEPQLPPETGPAEIPNSSGPENDLSAKLDALVASKEPYRPLGAGNWRATREAVRSFYVARAFRPIWFEGLELNAYGRSLLTRLQRADEDGLNVKGFDLPEASRAAQSEAQAADFDLAMTTAAVVYALEATGARITPGSISPLVTPNVAIADPSLALIDIAVAIDPGEQLRAFNPPQPGYQRLREKLAELSLTPPTTVAAGALTNPAATRSDAMPTRPAHLGKWIGRLPTPITPAAFDVAAQTQLRARIEANMELWRWEPRSLGADRLEVNIPEYSLKLFRDDREVDGMRVIVGKPDTPTPVFSNAVKYLLINPIWRVPNSIAVKEMLPKTEGDLSALESRGFKVRRIGNQIFVEQPPGEGNALGRLLFMFPNQHAVYLHDTPAHGLFGAPRRAFSHGCVRVEAPLRLASEVMGGDLRGWSEAKIQSLYGDSERWVFLPSPLPIHIEYFTVNVDEGGASHEHDDIYGLVAKVSAGLSRLGLD